MIVIVLLYNLSLLILLFLILISLLLRYLGSLYNFAAAIIASLISFSISKCNNACSPHHLKSNSYHLQYLQLTSPCIVTFICAFISSKSSTFQVGRTFIPNNRSAYNISNTYSVVNTFRTNFPKKCSESMFVFGYIYDISSSEAKVAQT